MGEYTTVGRTFYILLFETGSSSSPSYCHIFFLIAFFEEDFIRNIIIPCINYKIIIVKVKIKESRNRPGVVQRVPGGLGSQIL
jgi:hypothetical protein